MYKINLSLPFKHKSIEIKTKNIIKTNLNLLKQQIIIIIIIPLNWIYRKQTRHDK